MATEHDDYEDDFHSESEDESKRRSPAKASRGGAGSGAGAGGAAASYVDRRADDVNAASSSKEAEERDTEDKEEHGWEEVAFSEVELGPKPIGGGGFALVYKGEWRGRRVAVKTLFDPKVDDALKREYMDELHVMRELDHPNIVKFLGACVRPPKLCFLMELCDMSLFHLLHETRTVLPEKQLMKYATDIAEGIHYLHTRRPLIIHRDLKTHNSLIDRTGTVKLCDFGLVTTRNTTAGTPNYMAPELLSDKSFNKAVDVYAFGMMLWEMFTRQVPFHGWRAEDIKEHVTSGERLAIPKYDMPELAVELISQCWHQDPRQRPPMADVVRRLRDWKPYVSAAATVSGGDALDALM